MATFAEALAPANLKRAKADIKQYSIDHEPIRWANGHLTLAHQCIVEIFVSSGPTRAADKGIEHMEEALKVITEENDAPVYATVQSGLAGLYRKRVAGNRTENLTKALAFAETALRVCQHPSCPPASVAEVHEVIGSIYEDDDFASSNSRAANDDLAIRHYLASLKRSSMYDDNYNWADRHMKVGLSYYERKNGKRRSNLKVAIKHFVEALKVFTKSKHPDKWARIHEHLALSYGLLFTNFVTVSVEELTEEESAMLEKCIASCTNALQVFTPTYGPASW
jgi:tetratricopeptide (TPR) repeat protein